MTYPGNGYGGWSLPDSSGPGTSEMPPVGQYPPPYPPPSGKPRKSRRIWLVLFLVIVLIAALAVGRLLRVPCADRRVECRQLPGPLC